MEGDKKGDLKRSVFSEWLEKLQQESWQLELLISGFALYGIWAGRDFVSGVEDYIYLNRPKFILDSIPNLAGTFLSISWKIFFMNLLIHVVFRGIWIGTIGLRYVSGEIDYDGLNYSSVMTDYLKRRVGSFDDFIERLERFCSVLFAYTFLLFFTFLSLMMYVIWFNVLAVILIQFLDMDPQGTLVLSFIFFFLGLSVLIFIDFITFGAFKRIHERSVAKVYKYIYIVISYATLSFIYRPLLYNFLDDRYTKRLILLSIPYFILVIFVLPGMRVGSPYYPDFDADYHGVEELMEEDMVKWWYYDDLRKEAKLNLGREIETSHRIISRASLANFEVEGNFLRFFIRQSHKDTWILETVKKLIPLNDEGLLHEIQGVMNTDDSVLVALKTANREKMRNFRNDHEVMRKDSLSVYLIKADSIDDELKLKEREYLLNKLRGLKQHNFEFYRVFLDGVDCTHQLESRFYIHPNAGEKGFLCLLPIDSLSTGMHNFSVKRGKNFLDGEAIDWVENTIPFLRK